MNCEKYASLLDQYLMGEMTQQSRTALEAHLKTCPDCHMRLKVLGDCQRMNEEDEVPVSFSSSWRQHIQKEEVFMKKNAPAWTKWLATAAAIMVMLTGTWLTTKELDRVSDRQTKSAAAQAPEGGMGYYGTEIGTQPADNYDRALLQAAPAAESMMSRAAEEASGTQARQQKIIRTISMQSATRSFDADYQAIREAIEAAGGRMENADIRTGMDGLRTAYLTLRVPAGQLDTFAEKLKSLGHLQAFSESSEDVSEQYTDTSSRLATQKAKLERLMALMAKAVSVEDLISLESAIADTQYLIDSYTGQIQGMDSKVNDATLTLTLSEMSALNTAETKEEGLWQRITSGVSHMWKILKEWAADAAVFLALVLPVIAVTAIVGIIIKAIVKRRKNK